MKFTPLGNMLKDNLRTEWRLSDTTTNVYFDNDQNFEFVRSNYQDEVPFGVAKEVGTNLVCSYFVNPSVSREFFQKMQRQRKIWWMKFSSSPGRFYISNPVDNSVSIKSKFDFENFHLEKIEVLNSVVGLGLKDGKIQKEISVDEIKTSLCLDNSCLGILLDAVDSSENHALCLSRKLAPFKCSLMTFSQDPDEISELKELANHIANVLRKSEIAVLNTPKSNFTCEEKLKSEFLCMDRIGVPFCIVLKEQSLQNGLFHLRNRDTSVSETIHISDLPNYLLKIIN